MKIDLDHPSAIFGHPAILDRKGVIQEPHAGVRAVRDHLGMTQATLALACGVATFTVSQWESGRRAVPASALLVMRRLLKEKRGRKK